MKYQTPEAIQGEDLSERIRYHIKTEINARFGSLRSFCVAKDWQYADLHKYLSGKRDYSATKLFKLLAYLDTGVEFFFYHTEKRVSVDMRAEHPYHGIRA